MCRVGVILREDGGAANARLACRARHADGDLASVRDEHLAQRTDELRHGETRGHEAKARGWAEQREAWREGRKEEGRRAGHEEREGVGGYGGDLGKI